MTETVKSSNLTLAADEDVIIEKNLVPSECKTSLKIQNSTKFESQDWEPKLVEDPLWNNENKCFFLVSKKTKENILKSYLPND